MPDSGDLHAPESQGAALAQPRTPPVFLYGKSDMQVFCAAWLLFWVLMHHLGYVWWKQRPVDIMTCRARGNTEAYARRLVRSQFYCVLAVIGAVRLLSRCRKLPEDLLNDFCWEHQILFSMAVGHWLISIWEDRKGSEFLGAGLDEKAFTKIAQGVASPSTFLLQAYTIHHLMAASAYALILYFQRCSAVGTFGLLFELPVLMLNRRELALHANEGDKVTEKYNSRFRLSKAVYQDQPGVHHVPGFDDNGVEWLKTARGVSNHWHLFWYLFTFARGGPAVVYLYSLMHWREQLNTLATAEKVLYHTMAVFFTLLNYCFLRVLIAWMVHDHQTVRRLAARNKAMQEEQEAADVELAKANADEEGSEPYEPNMPPLLDMPMDTFERMTGKDGRKLMIAIDGAAYDVTEFQSEHPGGAQVLEKYGAKDATDAFRRVGHSNRAKAIMVRYMIGPIMYPPEEYRIFEHNHELWKVGANLLSFMVFFSPIIFVLSPRGFGGYAGPHSAADHHVGLVLLGLLIAALCGSITCIVSSCIATADFSSSWREHCLALSVIAHCVGFLGCCQGSPSGSLPGAPTGLELCAGAMLLGQVRWQRLPFPTDSAVFQVGVVVVSWVARSLAFAEPEGSAGSSPQAWGSAACMLFVRYGWSCCFAVLFGVGTPIVASGAEGDGAKEALAARVLHGLKLAAPYAWFFFFLMLTTSTQASAKFGEIWQMPWFRTYLFGAASISLFGLMSISSTAYIYSSHWACRTVAVTILIIRTCAYFHGYFWITLMGFIAHAGTLDHLNKKYMKQAAAAGKFNEVPTYVLGTQAIVDQLRATAATIVWRLLANPLQNWISHFLPDELRVFACEIPLFDLGDKVDMGIAAHISPKNDPSLGIARQVRPNYFVCNVGQISYQDTRGLQDVQRTMNTLRDCWNEFKQPDMAPGLISNVIAVFPFAKDGATKEINLSAWESSSAAHDWYVKSAGHRGVMHQHQSGFLQTFGNLLASLEPARPIRHQDRCRHCARVVEATQAGEHAPLQCGICGGPTFRYPFF